MRQIALIIGAGIADVAFADDRAENIEGGRRLGMNGIVFKDAKAGFEYCGIIHCWNGDERLAFQLTMLREQSQAIDGE